MFRQYMGFFFHIFWETNTLTASLPSAYLSFREAVILLVVDMQLNSKKRCFFECRDKQQGAKLNTSPHSELHTRTDIHRHTSAGCGKLSGLVCGSLDRTYFVVDRNHVSFGVTLTHSSLSHTSWFSELRRQETTK